MSRSEKSAHRVRGWKPYEPQHYNVSKSRGTNGRTSRDSSRIRRPERECLETILFNWCIRAWFQGTPITPRNALDAAQKIWDRLPEKPKEKGPPFTQSWCQKVFKRYDMDKAFRDPRPPQQEHATPHLYSHEENDIYNVEETGLCWHQNLSLSFEKQDLISVTLCSNATGTDRLPPLIVTRRLKTRRPKDDIFCGVSVIDWKSSDTGYVTVELMEYWLRKFYQHVGNRKVVLLLKGDPVREYAYKIVSPPPNITVLFSFGEDNHWRPFARGIILHFKQSFRAKSLEFMQSCFTQSIDPLKVMSLQNVAEWIIKVWYEHLSSTVIQQMFRKALRLDNMNSDVITDVQPGIIKDLYEQTIRIGNVRNPRDYTEFCSPFEDLIVDAAIHVTYGNH